MGGVIHHSAFPVVLGRLSTWPISKTFSRSSFSTAITTMLGYHHRFGAGQVDQPAEAVVRVFRAQGQHTTPHPLFI